MLKSLATIAVTLAAIPSVAVARDNRPPDWQGGLAPHSEVWWTGKCFMDAPAIHVGQTPLHGHFTPDGSLYVYPFKGERVVFDGVNLTNNLNRPITFAAACLSRTK